LKAPHKHTAENQADTDNLKKELDDTKNKLLRALADFDNFRKRAAIEKEELSKFGNETLVKDILPVLDGFGKALEHINTEGKDELTKGLALIKKQLEDALTRYGVNPIEALNKQYDPNFHEAILMKESDKEKGSIIEEMQTGFVMNGRVIRPSMVIVSKGKGEKI
jgi:molecular chaperone GrpE